MEHLGIAHAHILGHSLGGGTAINFALSYPDATDALVLVGSILGGFQWVEMGSTLDAIWSAGKESGVEEARELWLGSAWFSPALEHPGVASRLNRIVSEYSGWDWENDDPSVSLEPPAIERLDSIRAPTLAVVGERDTSDNHAIADTLHEGVPDARKVVMPGVGHMANMEDPESFNEIVLSFLVDVSSAA
jgi:pimeloyl-ACP methyl ester carboxylesterase